MTHGKFRTSVLCLLHTATNLPSAFPAFSPSSLQSAWPVSKRARLFKYCSAPPTYSTSLWLPTAKRGRAPLLHLSKPMAAHSYSCQESLAGYGPWGHKELDTTERVCMRARTHTHTHTHTRNGRYVAREFMQRNAGGSVRIMFRQQNICFCYHQDLWLRHSPAYFL